MGVCVCEKFSPQFIATEISFADGLERQAAENVVCQPDFDYAVSGVTRVGHRISRNVIRRGRFFVHVFTTVHRSVGSSHKRRRPSSRCHRSPSWIHQSRKGKIFIKQIIQVKMEIPADVVSSEMFIYSLPIFFFFQTGAGFREKTKFSSIETLTQIKRDKETDSTSRELVYMSVGLKWVRHLVFFP